LLHAGLALGKGITVDWSRNPLEDGLEQLWVEATNVTQGDSRARLQSFIELRSLSLLVGFTTEVLRWTEKYSQQVVDSLERRELLASRVRLGTYVFKSLARIKSDDVVFRLVLTVSNSQATQDDLGCLV